MMISAKPKFLLAVVAVLAVFLLFTDANAAEKGKPAAVAGNVVKTRDFEVAIPEGWIMPKQTRSSKRATAAIFSNNKALVAVELSVLDSSKSAREMANLTAKDMRSKKLVVSDPEEGPNGFYVMDVDGGPMPYRCWIGANGKLATITTVMGKDIGAANELLKAVKPAQPGMFPEKVR